jgi:hypothetical protein
MKLVRHAAALLLLAAAQLGPGCASSSGEDVGSEQAAISARGALIRARSGLCLRAAAGGLDLAQCTKLPDRGWDLVEVTPDYDQIRTVSGECLGVRDVRPATPPYVVTCVPASPDSDAARVQLWRVEQAPTLQGCGGGMPPEYVVRSLATGQCLGVSTTGQVIQAACNPLLTHQRWSLQ